MRRIVNILLLGVASLSWGQQPTPTPVDVGAQDPGSEAGKFKKNCPFKHPFGCLQVLFTGEPVHIAVGNLSPQNGFASGLAFVGGHDNLSGSWRNSWNADAVASPNGSWRTGIYVKFVDSRTGDFSSQPGTSGIGSNPTALPEQPVINVYAQTITLNKLMFFGLGPHSTLAGRSFYGMRETIAGVSLVKPLNDNVVNAAFYGEFNGRWVDIRPPADGSLPATQILYNEATAPGITSQPFFLQLGVGARMRPDFKRLHLNYDAAFRPYVAPSGSRFTFGRLTVDLQHEFQLYGRGFPVPSDSKGPDACSADPGGNSTESAAACSTQYTRDKVGTLGVRAFSSLSMPTASGGVPFYFQPTLGGGDINGAPSLPAYTDYRFRAPNVLLLRESFEHSLGKWPLGLMFAADQGKVAIQRGDFGSNPWLHTFSAGLTLRAGGFPVFSVLFAWGHEGTHILANVNDSLLGSSARPSLF